MGEELVGFYALEIEAVAVREVCNLHGQWSVFLFGKCMGRQRKFFIKTRTI
jgi:hypothetical protein